MTIEEKARAYEEALEDMRVIYPNLKGDAKLALEHAFPALAGSEDERIRRMCISAVNIAASADGGLLHSEASECLSWLEEQKDKNCLACDQHLKGYLAGRKVTEEEKQKENPKSADSIPSDCMSGAKYEDRDSEYVVFPEDALVVARACEKLEAHGYPELADALINVNLYTKEQKSAEWSEEDEKMRNALWNLLHLHYAQDNAQTLVGIEAGKFRSWLKSLRPSWKPSDVCYGAKGDPDPAGVWKPSEEHLSALLAVFNDPNNIGSQTCQLALTDLYEQLKKL